MNSSSLGNAYMAQTAGYILPKTFWRLETAYKRNSGLTSNTTHYAQSRLSKSKYGIKQSVWRV